MAPIEPPATTSATLLLHATEIRRFLEVPTFIGTIRIADTPDRGRLCEQTKSWRFAITQRRKYYRLREFEWCDGLTDYIDLHF